LVECESNLCSLVWKLMICWSFVSKEPDLRTVSAEIDGVV
jgi:hypothetical protein